MPGHGDRQERGRQGRVLQVGGLPQEAGCLDEFAPRSLKKPWGSSTNQISAAIRGGKEGTGRRRWRRTTEDIRTLECPSLGCAAGSAFTYFMTPVN